MACVFPSEEWIATFKEEVNRSVAHREAAAAWAAGPVALIVNRRHEIGLDEDFVIWLDLDHGVCREARKASIEEAEKAAFMISADYARWKQVILKELEPIKSMMQGKLRLRGDLPSIVRNVQGVRELVEASSRVDTQFLD